MSDSPSNIPRKIRDPEFGKRITKIADDDPKIPPYHGGRLPWIQKQIKERFGEDVSLESIRRWFAGEVKPRPQAVAMLAKILEVDEAYLSFGADLSHTTGHGAIAGTSAVRVLAGLLEYNDAKVTLPSRGDKAALKSQIDLYATVRSVQYRIHVVQGEKAGGNIKFLVPTNFEDVFLMGMVIYEASDISLIEITQEMVAKGAKRPGGYEVTLTPAELAKGRIRDLRNRF